MVSLKGKGKIRMTKLSVHYEKMVASFPTH
jgi:hypothetical protein